MHHFSRHIPFLLLVFFFVVKGTTPTKLDEHFQREKAEAAVVTATNRADVHLPQQQRRVETTGGGEDDGQFAGFVRFRGHFRPAGRPYRFNVFARAEYEARQQRRQQPHTAGGEDNVDDASGGGLVAGFQKSRWRFVVNFTRICPVCIIEFPSPVPSRKNSLLMLLPSQSLKAPEIVQPPQVEP